MAFSFDRIAHFKKCCSLIPEMGKYIENGINIDPKPITMKEFDVAGNIDGKVRHACTYITLLTCI
jgi:hypothetical protein|tara:strand:- start:233 stop:427 length:195 start_codon:yes stop_codon:yes gene_type:complete